MRRRPKTELGVSSAWSASFSPKLSANGTSVVKKCARLRHICPVLILAYSLSNSLRFPGLYRMPHPGNGMPFDTSGFSTRDPSNASVLGSGESTCLCLPVATLAFVSLASSNLFGPVIRVFLAVLYARELFLVSACGESHSSRDSGRIVCREAMISQRSNPLRPIQNTAFA